MHGVIPSDHQLLLSLGLSSIPALEPDTTVQQEGNTYIEEKTRHIIMAVKELWRYGVRSYNN